MDKKVEETLKELELLYPNGKEVQLKDKKKVIMPFGFGQYPKVLRLLDGVAFQAAAKMLEDEEKAQHSATEEKAKLDSMATIARFVVDNAERVVELCVISTDEPREFFDKLPPDQGMLLVRAILEVNGDFFVRRLLPSLQQVMGAVNKLGGATLLPTLSPTDTNTPK